MQPYATPDVYWQEIFPEPKPTFQTGVPIFLGYALEGPVNEPTMIYLWPQFEALFGPLYPDGYLYQAMQGFFENGGLLAYVVRLDDGLPTLEALRAGLDAAAVEENVDLICAPDISRRQPEASDAEHLEAVTALQLELLDHCRLLGSRMAILDGLMSSDSDLLLTQSGRLRSSYGALYHPWLWPTSGSGTDSCVPPCGHVAGIFSRSDQRVGAHKPPANEVLEGVRDLYTHPSATDQGLLFAGGVNYLRSFTGRGIRIWGARTLSDDPEWQQVNVRRLFITVGRWLERFLDEVSHEPHTPELWIRIMRDVAAFLDMLYQQGALKGATADGAYYVICDADTNPPEVIDQGLIVTEIGLAPAVPGEFIEVRIVHGSSGVSMNV